MRVLLVEDDDRVAGALEVALSRRGYEVTRAATAAAALAAPDPDLVLLDLGLPDRDGVAVCRELRERSGVAIIVLTARGEERDRVTGLRSGADDYVVKPYGIQELLARIDAVMRRAGPVGGTGVVEAGPVSVDLGRREVRVDGEVVAVTRKEHDLLALLARHLDEVVTREHILAAVWHTTWDGSSHTLDVHVASLRTKLGRPGLLSTVRGVGYRLSGEGG